MIPDLADGVCHVWWARRTPLRPGLLAPLDAVEQDRLTAYIRAADQERFAIGCNVVRRVVGAHLSVPPADVPLDRTCPDCARQHGKVRAPGVELSLSHSGDWVVVAFHGRAAVGVDVEEIRPAKGLADSVLSPAEARTLEGADANGFMTYWARKEAVVKATGDGLRVPLSDIEVSGPNEAPALISWAGRPGFGAGVQLVDLAAGAGYAAALAILSEEPVAVRHHQADDLLTD